jgi:putative oxidoreductase
MSIWNVVFAPYRLFVMLMEILQPFGNLLIRCVVAYFFFKAGLAKIDSWSTTVMLFTHEYKVPFFSPEMAAYTATFVELVMPVLLVIGLLDRVAPLILFIFNLMAVISYRHFLFSDDGVAGLHAHFYWGVLLLLLILHGYSKISLDHLWRLKKSWL